MTDLLVAVDVSEIHRGKLGELKRVVADLVSFVRKNEPEIMAYYVYFNEDETRMTVLQVHPDSASMELHMETAGPAFPNFKDLIRLSAIDLYGRPTAKLLEQMRAKARMLGGATLAVHEPKEGFARFAEPMGSPRLRTSEP